MEQRLINANKLRKDFLNLPNCYNGFSDTYDKAMIIDLVDEQPTVDAEPVKHGKWIEVDVCDCCYRCSECGFIRDAYLLDIGNYCPQCGAKMDEEKENGID